MRAAFGALYFAVVALLVAWAVWLLTTADPDGGRRPAGGVMLAVAVLLGIGGLLSVRRSRRGAPSRGAP